MSSAQPKNRPIFLDIPITNISKQDPDNRRVVAGYASFDVIDRQNERITREAVADALDKFMENPEFANTHVMHGNCTVGKVIPSYTDKNGEIWETKVDDTGTFIVSELRTDIKRANQTWELIENGTLKSYSIGGLALEPKELVCDNGTCHWEIDKLEIHEFSYVDRPAVRGADFIIVKREISPKPMICPLETSDVPEEEDNLNKGESHNSVEIIMPEPQAEPEPVSKDAVEPEPKSKKAKVKKTVPKKPVKKEEIQEDVSEVTEEVTEKADATPLMLEIKGMLEKVLANQEHMNATRPGNPDRRTDPEPQKAEAPAVDYPQDMVDALDVKFGAEKSQSLLQLLGEEAFRLLEAVKQEEEETVEEPAKEPTLEPADTEKSGEETPTDEDSLQEKIQSAVDQKVESTLEKYAQVQKRTIVPAGQASEDLSLASLYKTKWSEVDAIAQRGA